LSKLRSYRPSHAVVVAYLALFVALGGSSYAALTVTGKNVKDSSLTGKDIKNNSLTGSDVKGIKSGDVTDRSLLAKDFKAGQLPAGPQGLQGRRGDAGAPGTARGYALIKADGTLDTANSSHVDRSFKVSDGLYCVNFDFGVPRNVVATPYIGAGQVGLWATSNACSNTAGSYNVQVSTAGLGATSPADHAFYIVGN
jgi:hypothetical protein